MKKRHIGYFLAAAFLALLLFPGFAEAGAKVSIGEAQTLTFPQLALPSSGNSTNLTISPLNSSTSGTGEILSGIASRGQYAISLLPGGTPVSITIDISGVSTGNTGITLDNFQGYYNGQLISSFPSGTLPLPAEKPSSTPLYLGARVTANSTVAAGSYTATFSITVLVQ